MKLTQEEIMRIKPQIEKKKRKGKSTQYYLTRKKWINGKLKRVWQKYLGTPETIEKIYAEYENYRSSKNSCVTC